MKKAIIYLHGFNSASKDLAGKLLTSKQKLLVLDKYCQENQIKFCTPNVDYRNFELLITDLTQMFVDLEGEGYSVLFMGSSLGGFTSEYMAMKTGTKAIMVNPAISPSELLVQYIGVSENFEIKQTFDWSREHCEQFIAYENELNQKSGNQPSKTILLDMADELINSSITLEKYKDSAEVVTFEGGSHSFEHIVEAMPIIETVIDSL